MKLELLDDEVERVLKALRLCAEDCNRAAATLLADFPNRAQRESDEAARYFALAADIQKQLD